MATGLTKDAGWQLGVRRTVPLPVDEVWAYLLGEGLGTWLGETELGDRGDRYETAEGVHGQVRSRSEGLRIRLTWQPRGWEHDATLQITLRSAATGTTIGFHQERLTSSRQREEMLEHWHGVLTRIVDDLDAGRSSPRTGRDGTHTFRAPRARSR